MRYFDAFAGIGGFALGIKQAYESKISVRDGQTKDRESETPEPSMESATESVLSNRDKSYTELRRDTGEVSCIGYSEIDKYATQIYEKHFNHTNYGDVTKISPKDLPDFDLLVGGFPCQAFSIAGKRGGFDDTRGTMFFEIARIVREKQPRLLLLENVKGLLSHDKGNTFLTIITTLDELGYDCQWQVLNSKNHGVPQNRERVFIIGHLRGTSRPQVFPFGESGEDDTRKVGREISPTLMARDYKGIGGQEMAIAYEPRIRRLTPTECERLQGFPDGWTEGVSDTQRYKTLGNAVTVNVIRDIMISLK